MLHRYCQCNKFIQEPREVNSTFVFRYNHYFVTFFGIFFTELYHQAIMRVDWDFHIVQTSVARNHNNTFNLKVHFKHHRGPFYREVNLHFALLDLVSINIHKKLILQ